MERCTAGAKSVLGDSASVLRCGDLTARGGLEAIAVTPLSGVTQSQGQVAVSRVVVIRKGSSRWSTELNAQKQITNPVGYLGIDYIDDSYSPPGYLLAVQDHRSDNSPGLTLWFTEISPKGENDEATPIEVSWNPAVSRFQEFTTNQDPQGFRSEIKNPPHRKP